MLQPVQKAQLVRLVEHRGKSILTAAETLDVPYSEAALYFDERKKKANGKPNGRHHWTEKEKAKVLRLIDGGSTSTEAARLMKLTPKSVRTMIEREKSRKSSDVKKSRREWTEQDETKFQDMIDSGMTMANAARKLGRNPQTIYGMRTRRTMTRKSVSTGTIDMIRRARMRGESGIKIAERFGLKKDAVYRMIHQFESNPKQNHKAERRINVPIRTRQQRSETTYDESTEIKIALAFGEIRQHIFTLSNSTNLPASVLTARLAELLSQPTGGSEMGFEHRMSSLHHGG